MKILLVVGIPAIFAIGYFVYLAYKFIKAANDPSWMDYPFVEFDEIDTFNGDEKDK